MSESKQWIVKIRATVIKKVYCYNCTKVQAMEDLYDYAEDEVEVDQLDFEVISVEPNE